MPCSDAMLPIDKIITATPDQTVSDALVLFKKHKIRSVPVVDTDGNLVGIFNFSQLLKSILPSFAIEDDGDDELSHHLGHMELNMDFLADSSPWIASSLVAELPKTLKDAMNDHLHFAHEDTSLREGVRLIVKHGSPLPVVDKETNKLKGIITSQEAVTALAKVAEAIAKGDAA